jgi:hypothetical protein
MYQTTKLLTAKRSEWISLRCPQLVITLTLILAFTPSLQGAAQITPDSPSLVNSNGDSDSGSDSNPQLTTDGSGNWVAVWNSSEDLGSTAGTDQDILVATSTDNGANWTAPALLNTNGDSDSGSDLSPQISTDRSGNWVTVWQSDEDLGTTAGTDWDIFVSTSANNGVTWSAPALLNTNGTSDTGNDFKPHLSTDGSGNWVAVHYSNENLATTAGTDNDIVVAASTNNGVAWSAPAVLNTNGTSDTGGDTFPNITTDRNGNWVTVWHSSEDLGGTAGGDSDIFVATSANNGGTWSAPALLNTNGTTDFGADAKANVSTDGAGNWVAAWTSDEILNFTAGSDSDIFVATSMNNGTTWTSPALLNTNGTSDSGLDIDPRSMTDEKGNWVTVWYSTEDLGSTAGTDVDNFLAESVDNGATWSAPALLNTNADTDSGDDSNPQLATDRKGNWVSVWTSTEDLASTAGTDTDIFATRWVIAVPPGMPAATAYLLAALAIVLAISAAHRLRRKT